MDRLCDSYKLVRIVCACPDGKVSVPGAEDLIASHYKVTNKALTKVTVKAFDNDELKNIQHCQNKLRVFFVTNSLPWDQQSYRLFPNVKFGDLDTIFNETQIEMKRLELLFLDAYDREAPKRQLELGDLYGMIKFPKREHFRGRIRIDRSEIPVPSPGDDPRAGWSEEQKKEFQIHIESEQKIATNLALINVADRIIETVGHVYEKTTGYKGTKKGSFRDSMIENCRDLSELISTLNINNDPTIEKIRGQIKDRICKYTPDEIRKDKDKLSEVREASADILERMGEFASTRRSEIGVDAEDEVIGMSVI